MIWAVDLDPYGLTQDAYLASQGTNSGFMDKTSISNPVYAMAANVQNSAQVGLVWSPCLSAAERKCPYGYHSIGMVAFGKVFDLDLNSYGNGCRGSNNRVLCVPASMELLGCDWNRDGKGVSLRWICRLLTRHHREKSAMAAAQWEPIFSRNPGSLLVTEYPANLELTSPFVATMSR